MVSGNESQFAALVVYTTVIRSAKYGVSWFETEPRLEELSFAIVRLQNLMIECNTSGIKYGVVLKLLITSSRASIHTKHLFPRETQLAIPSDTLGNGHGFNARQMAMLLGSATNTK
jgi:hypothetical protein